MTPLFAMRALLFAGELFAGSAILMALAWCLGAGRAASARHLAWTGAFGAALALPLLALIVPSPLHILLHTAPAAAVAPPLAGAGTAMAAPDRMHADAASVLLWLGALWLAGTIVAVLRIATAALCLMALRRRSRPFALAPEHLPRVAATHRECELRISDSENGPITWGVLRPVVLLPRTAVFWPRERLHAVLLHELAHIRRRDSLVQALSLIACALYWPNPLVWLGAHALRREAEMAADDSVLVAGFKASTYARELLDLAHEFRGRAAALPGLSLFMAGPSALAARVESVLEPEILRSGVTGKDVLRIGLLGFVSAAALAFACPSLAQDAGPPAPPAPEMSMAPPAPPAPAVPATPVVPATPAVPDVPPAPPTPRMRIRITAIHALHPARPKCLHAALKEAAREAHAAMLRARPEITRALADQHLAELTVRESRPQIEAAMREADQAMRQSGPAIARALESARAGEAAARAVQKAQFEQALTEARDALAQAHVDAQIRANIDAALAEGSVRRDSASGDSDRGPADHN